jgi:hypothetical protein
MPQYSIPQQRAISRAATPAARAALVAQYKAQSKQTPVAKGRAKARPKAKSSNTRRQPPAFVAGSNYGNLGWPLIPSLEATDPTRTWDQTCRLVFPSTTGAGTGWGTGLYNIVIAGCGPHDCAFVRVSSSNTTAALGTNSILLSAPPTGFLTTNFTQNIITNASTNGDRWRVVGGHTRMKVTTGASSLITVSWRTITSHDAATITCNALATLIMNDPNANRWTFSGSFEKFFTFPLYNPASYGQWFLTPLLNFGPIAADNTWAHSNIMFVFESIAIGGQDAPALLEMTTVRTVQEELPTGSEYLANDRETIPMKIADVVSAATENTGGDAPAAASMFAEAEARGSTAAIPLPTSLLTQAAIVTAGGVVGTGIVGRRWRQGGADPPVPDRFDIVPRDDLGRYRRLTG